MIDHPDAQQRAVKYVDFPAEVRELGYTDPVVRLHMESYALGECTLVAALAAMVAKLASQKRQMFKDILRASHPPIVTMDGTEKYEQCRALLRSALAVMNAHSVGYATQAAIEKFLKE